MPVIGLVQVGDQAMADRYTYLTQIGLYVAMAWSAVHMAGSWPYRRWAFAAVSALVMAGLMACAWQQTRHWRDSETLWTRTLACTSQNPIAQYNLGVALADHGRVDEAIGHFREALEIKPDYAEAHFNLAVAFADRGQVAEAITHYLMALEIKPDYARAHYNLGVVLAGRERFDEAISHLQKALEIKPDYADAHFNLGNALASRGRFDAAIGHYRKALEIKPDYANACNNLAWLRATCPEASVRNGSEAVALAQQAVQLLGRANAACLDTLAAAYAEAGRFAEAMQTAHKALDLARQQNKQGLAESIQAKIQLYAAGIPFHESQSSPAGTSLRP